LIILWYLREAFEMFEYTKLCLGVAKRNIAEGRNLHHFVNWLPHPSSFFGCEASALSVYRCHQSNQSNFCTECLLIRTWFDRSYPRKGSMKQR
jgi:hypothetical protein